MADMFAFRPASAGSQVLLPPLRPLRTRCKSTLSSSKGRWAIRSWESLSGMTSIKSRHSTQASWTGLNSWGFSPATPERTPAPALERLLRRRPIPSRRTKPRTACRSRNRRSVSATTRPRRSRPMPCRTARSICRSSPAPEKTYDNVKSILRLTALRLQDGWARLEFAPEIHHGVERLRPIVTDGRWQPRETQEIDALPQHFSLKLHVGEIAHYGRTGESAILRAPGVCEERFHPGSAAAIARGAALEHVANRPHVLRPGMAPAGSSTPSVSYSK